MSALERELAAAKAEIERLRARLAEKETGTDASVLAELERSNQELKQFAYIISHDLKAPLRAISSLVQWISEDYADAFDEDGQERMELLQGRVRRMEQLIEGVLHYSRIGRIVGESEAVNLNKLVTELIDLLNPPSHIDVRVLGRLPVVYGEKTRLGQVFQNLLSNAIKFMDKERGEIQVACEEEEALFRFSVTDNGPGIPEKDHERIFQIFQTLQARDTYESTGVGLTLVKKIVELNGGTVSVDSREGRGSRFIFTLPKATVANASAE